MIPRLHMVTDDGILAREGFLSRAVSALEVGGGDVALHLRGPRTSGRDLFSLAQSLVDPARESGSLLLVNDRVDVALVLDLAGAHLGQRSLPPGVARRLLGDRRLLGLSVHGAEEAAPGEEAGVDFFLVGTIFPTPSHPQGTAGGTSRLCEVGRVTARPLLAIGGVTPERVPELLEAGAHGVAVRGGVWEAGESGAAVRVYLERVQAALGRADSADTRGLPGNVEERG